MAPTAQVEVRPRTTGEILDDAWRLYLADAPLLLATAGLFTIPAALTLLLLLTRPAPEAWWKQVLVPALVAGLLPLTALGSAACQQAFRRRADNQVPGLADCLRAALRRGWEHAAARALLWTPVLLGMLMLVIPGIMLGAAVFLGILTLILVGLPVWIAGVTVHPILAAGEGNWLEAFRSSSREAQRQPGKVAVIVLSRLILLALAVINLHTLVIVGLWIAENLAGFDTALLGILLALNNPLYFISLVLLSWLLLTPLFETTNYLLHVDSRARYEGLDLWYRVQRYFPLSHQTRIKAAILFVCGALFAVTPLSAAADRLTIVQGARQETHAIQREVSAAAPYPGGARWEQRLRGLADQLDGGEDPAKSSYRWFRKAIEGFARRNRDGAVQVLEDLDRRLGLIEENLQLQPTLSTEEIKNRLPASQSADGDGEPAAREAVRPPPKAEVKRPVRQDDPELQEPGGGGGSGRGILAPQPAGGLDLLGWMILAGALLTILVVAFVLFRQQRRKALSRTPSRESGQTAPSLETILTQPEQYSVAGLWGQADELAHGGNYREAVRMLYLAVLALLHRANLIRFERTRTNGEYVHQLRSHTGVHEPFTSMTSLFEVNWYSESLCQPVDYHTCRDLAENIREGMKSEA